MKSRTIIWTGYVAGVDRLKLPSNQLLKPLIWQCARRIVPWLQRFFVTSFQFSIRRCEELLSKCRRVDVQSRISAPPKSLGCPDKFDLWGILIKTRHTFSDQANRRVNQCHFHSASDSPKQWYSLHNVHWNGKISILCDMIWLHLERRNDLCPLNNGNFKLGEYLPGRSGRWMWLKQTWYCQGSYN